jgi:hypothetical protein
MGMHVSPRKDWQNRIGLCGNAYHFGSGDWFPPPWSPSHEDEGRGCPILFRGVRERGLGTLNLYSRIRTSEVFVQVYALALSIPSRD